MLCSEGLGSLGMLLVTAKTALLEEQRYQKDPLTEDENETEAEASSEAVRFFRGYSKGA